MNVRKSSGSQKKKIGCICVVQICTADTTNFFEIALLPGVLRFLRFVLILKQSYAKQPSFTGILPKYAPI